MRVHRRRRKISRDATFHTSKDARETMISSFVGEGSITFFLKVQYRFLYFFFSNRYMLSSARDYFTFFLSYLDF